MEDQRARLEAMAEVLRIMTRTSFDLQAVLEAVVERASRLGRAQSGFIYRLEGDRYRMDVALNASDEFRRFTEQHPIEIDNFGTLTARVGKERRAIHIPDVLADPTYNYWEAQRLGSFRTLLGVPLLRDDHVLGVLNLWRTQPEPFSDEEIQLVALFADQAAVAIEQARRAHELADALEQQTATSDVLRIISQSTTDLEAVFLPLITRATQLCGADHGDIIRLDPQTHEYLDAAHFGVGDDAYREVLRRRKYRPSRNTLVERTLLERAPVRIDDVLADPEYRFIEAQQAGGFRSILGVPLLREGFPIGVISVWRRQVKPFSDREIRVVTAFADQAVVAIENVRRTRELADALEQQTAASEVLRIISRSTGDLAPVFEALIKSAVELCTADHGGIIRFDPRTHEYIETADYGVGSEEYRQTVRRIYQPGRDTLVGRTIVERAPVSIDDVLADPDYKFAEAQRTGGFRSILGVPMLQDGFPIGVIAVWRRDVRPFSDREIRILTTFADQAVVAIENVRLVRALQRQTEELSRYVTPQVASLLASEEGEQLLAGHRRLITAVFCDLRGFSGFSETAEPEEVFGVLREYQAEMGRLIAEYGGTLEHLAGDGIMAFFNDPVPTTGFEGQTIRCAVAMRDAFQRLASGWRRRGYELGLGIGVALGYATLGRVGYEGHYQYNAIGNVAILASRLSDEAEAGEVLITQRLHAAIEDLVLVGPPRQLSVKGFSRPVPAYPVMSLADRGGG